MLSMHFPAGGVDAGLGGDLLPDNTGAAAVAVNEVVLFQVDHPVASL